MANLSSGVVEGFFGKPWGWAARQSSIDFLRGRGYRFYIYAPKGDPFLRRQWREPLPDITIHELKTLSSRCRSSGLSFGIGLTPFEIYLNFDRKAREALRAKVQQLNDIHADIFCILFDDMRGDVEGLPALQAEIISDVCTWSSASHFIICPTYYSYDSRLASEFGPPSKTYLQDLGRILDSSIDIFWTGEKVISDGYSARHLTDVASAICRKPFIWDNRVSNDSRTRTEHLFLDPASGAWELHNDLIAGFAINPMNQPYLSRIALCRYQWLLGRAGEPASPMDSCLCLASPPCGQQLSADQDRFQRQGLEKLDGATRSRLIGVYEAERADPYAQEVAAWLRGDYIFDPQCLTA